MTDVDTTAFDQAVLQSIAFLRAASRDRGHIGDTRKRFQALRRRFRTYQLELVVDAPPGNLEVDYDVLISNDLNETTMLGWHNDDGRPWSVDYSHHWAANYVATVNDRHITIREALTFLRESRTKDPNLFGQLIDQALMVAAVDQDSPSASDREIALAESIFRRAYRISSDDEFDQWLKSAGMNRDGWITWLVGGVIVSKFRERLSKGRVHAYFDEHREGLAEVLVHQVSLPDVEAAHRLLKAAATVPLQDAVNDMLWQGMTLSSQTLRVRADEMPLEARSGVGSTAACGPFVDGPRQVVYGVLKMRKARLDTATRALICTRLVAQWLAAQRQTASVIWHW